MYLTTAIDLYLIIMIAIYLFTFSKKLNSFEEDDTSDIIILLIFFLFLLGIFIPQIKNYIFKIN